MQQPDIKGVTHPHLIKKNNFFDATIWIVNTMIRLLDTTINIVDTTFNKYDLEAPSVYLRNKSSSIMYLIVLIWNIKQSKSVPQFMEHLPNIYYGCRNFPLFFNVIVSILGNSASRCWKFLY